MARRYRRPPTAAQRKAAADQRAATVDELHAQLSDGLRTLTDSRQWRRWLDVASRFSSYSARNQLLIMLNAPEGTTAVAGYREWQKHGRQVRKGEKGIKILAPVTRKVQQDTHPHDHSGQRETDPRYAVVGVRPATVFALEQTDGEPMPTPAQISGDGPDGLWEDLQHRAEQHGFAVQLEQCAPEGYTRFDIRSIGVRADRSPADQTATLAHELGHVLLHDPDRNGQVECRGVKELEAESVSYIVTGAWGLDTRAYTFPYVATWAESAPEGLATLVGDTAARVTTAAHALLEDPAAVAEETAQRAAAGAERTQALRQTAERDAYGPPHDELTAVVGAAVKYWQHHAAEADAWLRTRGLGGHAAEAGYAPQQWTGLVDTLREAGHRDDAIEAAGVASRSKHGRLIDRFRGRVMFTIRDHTSGVPVGAIGRDTTGHTRAPKWLNTPTTALYTKGQQLHGLYEGRDRLQSGEPPVLVEGPLDREAAQEWQIGVPIDTAGTALTAEQVTQLRRAAASQTVLVAFDNDQAGQQAAARAYPLLVGEFPECLQVELPPDADPVDANAHQAGGSWGHRPLADAVVDAHLPAGGLPDATIRSEACRAAGAAAAQLPPEQWQRQAQRISTALDVPITIVQQAILDTRDSTPHLHSSPTTQQGWSPPRTLRSATDSLAITRHR